MTEPIVLPPGVALAIIAFLLSLLPAGLFIWLWYLRRHDRPVSGRIVAFAFGVGLLLVWPAFKLEEFASSLWSWLFPGSAHYFAGAILPLQTAADIIMPAVGTFFIVATVEEGLRFLFLRLWLERARSVDQVFDGIVVGIACGLGFATLENTLYFLSLFAEGSFDTLVFVFFLRFLISTLAHIGFGGIMGGFVARGLFTLYRTHRRRFIAMAFFIPWFVHGLYDLLLGLNQTLYAVLILVPGFMLLVTWMGRRDFFIIERRDGRLLAQPEPAPSPEADIMKRIYDADETPWNRFAPWLRERHVRYTILEDLKKRSR